MSPTSSPPADPDVSGLRVTFVLRGDWETVGGGDRVQIRETAQALARLGVDVTRFSVGRDDPSAFASADVVHLFHLDRPWECAPALEAAQGAGKPVVLSPIYWPMDELDRNGRSWPERTLARTFGASVYQSARLSVDWTRAMARRETPFTAPALQRARRAMLAAVKLILPNSEAEHAALAAHLGDLPPAVIVPNGADPERFAPARQGAEPSGVLCVGRIEPRKNQLALVEALRGCDVPLTFVGPVSPRNRRYAAACRRAAGPNVRFVEAVAQDGLVAHYRAARVHCCPSWYETPGLANLEAALSGCGLALSRRGAMPEYFGAEAVYFEPGDRAGMRDAVLLALARPPDSATLIRRIRDAYTWQHAAARTAHAYARALET